MADLILDSAQAQIVLQARDEVRFCDTAGNVLGVLIPATQDKPEDKSTGYVFTDEEIEEAKRRRDAPGPCFTTQEVLAHLRALRPEFE